jgi:hypothetical protein
VSSEPWQQPQLTPDLSIPPGPPAPRDSPGVPWVTRAELLFAARMIAILLIVGAVVGLLWRLWASSPTRGLVYYHSAIVPDESEGFISSDGKFAVMTAVVGLIAGALAWRNVRYRGPVGAGALAVGGVAGAALSSLVGHLVGGGGTAGKLGTQLPRLPLEVHSTGLLFVEGALALFVYLLFTLFAATDDLGAVVDAPLNPALSST